jgi:hypothetical protein
LGSATSLVSAGNFAGNLASTVTGGLSSIAGSLGGMTKGSVAGLAGLLDSAKGVAGSAFTAISGAVFLGLSALAHFVVVSPKFFPRYIAGLAAHRNFFRWVEYSISSSVMIVLIAQVTGISEVTALISIFGVNASMILFGWLQEKYEEPGSGGWVPFIFGCITGIVPWLALVFYVFAIGGAGENKAPTFVYFIVFTIFVLFNSFALVQFVQYKKIGKWSDYLRGERTYITLSLVAKSLLAWQIFANTLIPV